MAAETSGSPSQPVATMHGRSFYLHRQVIHDKAEEHADKNKKTFIASLFVAISKTQDAGILHSMQQRTANYTMYSYAPLPVQHRSLCRAMNHSSRRHLHLHKIECK
jgi:hypothetical protein